MHLLTSRFRLPDNEIYDQETRKGPGHPGPFYLGRLPPPRFNEAAGTGGNLPARAGRRIETVHANIGLMLARVFSILLGPLGALSILLGCDAGVSTPPPVAQDERQSSSGGISGGCHCAEDKPVGATDDSKGRQADFLNRIRQTDPRLRTIDLVMLNHHDELGLVLDGSVGMDKVADLMRTILGQMAREFPGQDLIVLALHAVKSAASAAQNRHR